MTDDLLTKKACELLGGDGLSRLRASLARRLTKSDNNSGHVKIRDISGEERSALERLLGCPGRFKAHAAVRTTDLESMLIPLGFSGLRDALERVVGPLDSRRQEQEALTKTWNGVRDFAFERLHARFCDREATDDAFRQGLIKRLSGNDPIRCRTLIVEAAHVLDALNDRDRNAEDSGDVRVYWSRAELAARTLGDSHSLDVNQPLNRFLRLVSGRREEPDADFWQTMGVSCLATSSTALILNVRFASGVCAKAANAGADAGEPFRMTLRALRDNPLAAVTDEVSICENPAVLEAGADRWAADCRPIICTEGQPSVACRQILRILNEAGARLRYHGDFDWGGVRIANGLFREFPALTPWRYDVAEYERLATDPMGGFILQGNPVDAVWDPFLRPLMERERRGYHEELSLADLIDDLKPGKL